MATRARRLGRLALAVAVVSLTILGLPAASGADEPSPGELAETLIGQVQDTIGDAGPSPSGGGSGSGGTGPARPGGAQTVQAPTSAGDSEGHQAPAPDDPDHASGSVLEVKVLGEEVLTVGKTYSEVDRSDDSSRGDVTVLAVGGNEIVGAHSDSRSGPESDSADSLTLLCEESEGSVCVGLLFADTRSTESSSASHSDSRASLAFACVGGSESDPGQCDGAIRIGVATSHSEIDKDKRSGTMTAASETAVADLCLGGGSEGSCEGLGLKVLHARSSSQATATDQPGSTDRYSCTAELEVQGDATCVVEDPLAIALPPDCPSDPGSLVCIFLNQGRGFVFIGGAGSRQEALHVELLRSDELPGGSLLELHAAAAETLVHAQPPQAADEAAVLAEVLGVSAGGERAVASGRLADTGASLAELMVLALLLLAAGAIVIAVERRRAAVLG